MNDDLCEQIKQWAKQAEETGYLTTESVSQLLNIESVPENLLITVHENTRPLLVAFMGGTGVGKSSLLNRLAGKAIAKAGIERPTSREVTLFHHNSVTIQSLALTRACRIAQHDDNTHKNIVWIDMPDFDSTELNNENQVLQWLPHIDVLLYVVSPERYRDAKAWRLLRSHGAKHAWLFILNQWDKACLAQYDDFKTQLQTAGFHAPLIFKTSCTEPQESVDDFEPLTNTLNNLATEHSRLQLKQHLALQRKSILQQKLQHALTQIGSTAVLQNLMTQWQTHWQTESYLLQQGLSLNISQISTYYAERAASLPQHNMNYCLWDNWAQTRFSDILQTFIVNSAEKGVPHNLLKRAFNHLEASIETNIEKQTELALRIALIKPGHKWQRALLTVARYAEISLPLLAMAWVSYKVFIGYYNDNVPYLGIDFAVHSSLLIAITWLVPFFILKKARPSLKKSALNALNHTLKQALQHINEQILIILSELVQQHSKQTVALKLLIEQCNDELPSTIDANSPLNQMLMN